MLHEYFVYMSNEEVKRQCDCLIKLIKAIHLFSHIANDENESDDDLQIKLASNISTYQINGEDKFDVKLLKIPLIK